MSWWNIEKRRKQMTTHYIVQTATAQMPSKVRAPYGRVAVLEVVDGVERVSMISDRAKGVVRVVETWERQHAGGGPGSNDAFRRALCEAMAKADMLNSINSGAPVGSGPVAGRDAWTGGL
jgi:hypothetical protein